jgi:hypothetical protein
MAKDLLEQLIHVPQLVSTPQGPAFFAGCERQLGRHLPEFLTAFGYGSPVLRTVAVNVHFGIEPTRVIKSTSFDEPEFRGYLGYDWRSALWTKVLVNWWAAVTSIVKRFEISLDRDS